MTPPATLGLGAPDALRQDVTCNVRQALDDAAARLRAEGVAVPLLEGKLLRPLVAYALVPPHLRGEVDHRFWLGALSVQMVHEASLLHDDILDHASQRRGHETLVASQGVGPALVLGDQYLTGAYRAAAAAAAPDFLLCFIRAVERTVAGEVEQERSVGRALGMERYTAIVTGKSGELFGAATCLGGALFGLGRHQERVALGCRLGALYQQVDDLLDYCPAAQTGKPPFQDYHQRKWTWILGLAGMEDFGLSEGRLLELLFQPGDQGPSVARQALQDLENQQEALLAQVQALSPGDEVVAQVLGGWIGAARAGIQAQEVALSPASPVSKPSSAPGPESSPSVESAVASLAARVGGPGEWPAYFGRHARTFRFAARFFPPEPAALISGVYAFCRFTDDLVDDPVDGAGPEVLEERLERWAEMARAAFEGHQTGIPLLDVVLGEAGTRGVSWRYPDALLSGVGMDLTVSSYADWSALEEYTFGVAGAVGGWITQLFGIIDEDLLDRAHALGHGMQLTNIARDVGEDLGRGRVYIPEESLAEQRLTAHDLKQIMADVAPVPHRYAQLTEKLLERAERYYDDAWPGIVALPMWYRRPVAVAAQAYRGIHDEIRRNGHDNLRLRAHTSRLRKSVLAAQGLWRARG